MNEAAQTDKNATTAINALATECVRNVVAVSKFENLEITQKYESLVCEKNIEPAPAADKANKCPPSVSKPIEGKSGATMPAVEIIATVELPCAVLKIADKANGIAKPKPDAASDAPNTLPKSKPLMTSPNAPPAAVTAKIAPDLSKAISKKLFMSFFSMFLNKGIVSKMPTKRATIGSPKNFRTENTEGG